MPLAVVPIEIDIKQHLAVAMPAVLLEVGQAPGDRLAREPILTGTAREKTCTSWGDIGLCPSLPAQ